MLRIVKCRDCGEIQYKNISSKPCGEHALMCIYCKSEALEIR